MAKSFIITVFAPSRKGNTSKSLQEIQISLQQVLQSINSNVSEIQSRILSDSSRLAVIEFKVVTSDDFDLNNVKANPEITNFETQNNVEMAFQSDTVYRRYKRLAVFDMDSTLIQQEVIDEIARKLNVEDKVSAITERAMNGELDFTASLRERVALLRGTPTTIFEELKSIITLTPGASDLVKALKKLGYKTAVLSGGFKPLTPWLADKLQLDYAHANNLVTSDDGKELVGEVTGDIVHAERKKELVLEIAKENSIPLDQVFVVGDGANDLPMMSVAGLGIAFNAKPRVQQLAPVRLNSTSLLDALYLLGLSESEINTLVHT